MKKSFANELIVSYETIKNNLMNAHLVSEQFVNKSIIKYIKTLEHNKNVSEVIRSIGKELERDNCDTNAIMCHVTRLEELARRTCF